MNKSVLIIETPANCEECSLVFAVDGSETGSICRGCKDYKFNPNSKYKPPWCPLTLLPKPKELNLDSVPTDSTLMEEWFTYGLINGYNNCLDDIQKGEQNANINE